MNDLKKYIVAISLILICVNLLCGALLSCYQWTNVILGCLVILSGMLALILVWTVALKDAFRVSLSILFVIAEGIEFVMSIFMPSHLQDNWGLIVIILMIVSQALILMATNFATKKIS